MSALIAGSRGSTLARIQTQHVIAQLHALNPAQPIELKIIKTQGDHIQDTPLAQIGGKGVFTKELEEQLLSGAIDCAVHSLKDLPVELPAGLHIAAYLPRECPNDVLISKYQRPLAALPVGAMLATGSLRRRCQLRHYRPDLQFVEVRGNIETRLAKLRDNSWDGLILAYAALARLDKTDVLTEIIPETLIYPAVGQGIIAVEVRAEQRMTDIFAALNDPLTEACALAERAFLAGLGGGCQVPVGVISEICDGQLHLAGRYLPADGQHCLEAAVWGDVQQPTLVGKLLAAEILQHEQKDNARQN
jgi:hydroxymethylbilane synthase